MLKRKKSEMKDKKITTARLTDLERAYFEEKENGNRPLKKGARHTKPRKRKNK